MAVGKSDPVHQLRGSVLIRPTLLRCLARLLSQFLAFGPSPESIQLFSDHTFALHIVQHCSFLAALFEGGKWSSIFRFTALDWTALLYEAAGRFAGRLLYRCWLECLSPVCTLCCQ